jgi:RimJ/RimL family protein N-acetyltransferase
VHVQPYLQPTLTGDTVLIRPLRAEDWREMYLAASDPLIWKLHPVSDRYKEYFDGGLASNAAFAICDKATGEIVGCSRYHALEPQRNEIEIGWTFLVRGYCGCWQDLD